MKLLKSFYSSVNRLNRAERGLYAGRSLSYGNTISDFGNRNRRTWKPNVQRCSLYSALLGQKVSLKASTAAIRMVDRVGGLDNYILGQQIPESECAKKLKEKLLAKKYEIEMVNNKE